jgi:hypothetical protein
MTFCARTEQRMKPTSDRLRADSPRQKFDIRFWRDGKDTLFKVFDRQARLGGVEECRAVRKRGRSVTTLPDYCDSRRRPRISATSSANWSPC